MAAFCFCCRGPSPDQCVALRFHHPPVLLRTNLAAPTNFVLQILEQTGGKIQRPRDWFYSASSNSYSYTWILSREDMSKAPHTYVTGVRIQMLVGIKEGTKKTPEEFATDFLLKKRLAADKVIKNCPPSSQHLFTRACLETEEGPYHILYSVFWSSDKSDIVVVNTSGTPKALWDTYAPVFDRMGDFELMDMQHLEK